MRLRVPFALVAPTLAALVACGSAGAAGDDGAGGEGGASSGGFGGSSGGAAGGGDGATCAATAAATEKPAVDIVFSIDNSGSMGEEMAEIQRNVNRFAQRIGRSGLDYRVVFVVRKSTPTTRLGICVPEPLAGPGCVDQVPTFRHVDHDVQSHNVLADLITLWNGGRTETWKTTLRPEAFKVFVALSDDGDQDLSAEEFDRRLLALDPAMFGTATARRYMVHAICPWREGTAVEAYEERCPTADGYGRPYRDIAKLTGGVVDSVCKTDYSATLDNLAKGIVDRLACELGVPSAAAADPAKVAVRATSSKGAVIALEHVTDASKCGQFANGWYYDDPARPSKIVLCKGACDGVATDEGAKVEALVGCQTAGPR